MHKLICLYILLWPSLFLIWTSLVAQTVKQLLQCGRPRFHPWVGKIPLEKEMATHSSTLNLKNPVDGEPGRLQSMGPQRVRHDWATSLCTLLQIIWSSSECYASSTPLGVDLFFFLHVYHTYVYFFSLCHNIVMLTYDYVVLVHNNIPQTRWLQPTETYCLSVLEARSPKSRCWLGHAPSEGCREGSVSASILALIASGGSFAYRYIIPNLHLYIFPLCLYITFPLGMSLYPNVPFQ